jgi:type IV pilus assembly protein PilX
MNRLRIRRATPQLRSRQRGVALAVALILLVVAVMLGLAASSNTLLQERMSANLYDRSLAFQRAESGLRAAEAAIAISWKISDLSGTDCQPAVAACPEIPANTFTGTDATWVDVGSDYDVNDSTTPGKPQYTIELMGTGTAGSDIGTEDNADAGMYGTPSAPSTVAYYRITARSSKPSDAGDRSIVVLQSTARRSF